MSSKVRVVVRAGGAQTTLVSVDFDAAPYRRRTDRQCRKRPPSPAVYEHRTQYGQPCSMEFETLLRRVYAPEMPSRFVLWMATGWLAAMTPIRQTTLTASRSGKPSWVRSARRLRAPTNGANCCSRHYSRPPVADQRGEARIRARQIDQSRRRISTLGHELLPRWARGAVLRSP